MESTEWLVEAWHDARPMMQAGMFLIPRRLMNEAGAWNESMVNCPNDDFEFFARLFCHAKEILFTRETILYYRSGITGSLSRQKKRNSVELQAQSLLLGTGHLIARRQDPEAKLSCANVLQDFIFTYYPDYVDLRAKLAQRVLELGGSDLSPDGPPRFQKLQKLIGWKLARRIQRVLGKK
jgi:hypothetical protein